jgi:hypothetical protein
MKTSPTYIGWHEQSIQVSYENNLQYTVVEVRNDISQSTPIVQ